jgi:hypothetical protein
MNQTNKVKRHIEEVYTKLSSQIYDLHQSSTETAVRQQRDIPLQHIKSIINKLEPPEFEADQFSALSSWHHESGNWILENTTFLKWTGSKALPDSVLFIHGMPGAGMLL